LQTKAVNELLHAQNENAFVIVAPFSPPFVCKLARVAVLANTTPLRMSDKQKVEVQTFKVDRITPWPMGNVTYQCQNKWQNG